MNVDTTFDSQSNTGAWGFIVRYGAGDFIAAAAGKLAHIRDPLHAEAEASLEAIEAAADLGVQRVVFESDCQVLVNALKSKEFDVAEVGVLIREARSLCCASFESAEFTFCRRECNKVAHVLAQQAYRALVPLSIWTENAPVCVSVLVASECAEHQS